MEKIIKQANEIATEALKKCQGKYGYCAAYNKFKNYWARDAFFATFGFLLIFLNYSISRSYKLIFILIIAVPGSILICGYFRLMVGKPTFSRLFKIFQLHRISYFQKVEDELLEMGFVPGRDYQYAK